MTGILRLTEFETPRSLLVRSDRVATRVILALGLP